MQAAWHHVIRWLHMWVMDVKYGGDGSLKFREVEWVMLSSASTTYIAAAHNCWVELVSGYQQL